MDLIDNVATFLPSLLSHTPFDDDQSNSTSSNTTGTNSSSIFGSGCTLSSDQDKESFNSPEVPAFSDITCNEHATVVHESHEVEPMSSEVECGNSSLLLGFKLVGDNIDKNVRPRHMRQDKQTLSMHYYHSYAVRDRVSISGLSDAIPDLKNVPLLSIPVNNVLPSDSDHQSLMHNFALLVSRHLVDHIRYFKENYSDIVIRHIKHDYYDEMSQKSETVYSMHLYHHNLILY